MYTVIYTVKPKSLGEEILLLELKENALERTLTFQQFRYQIFKSL